MADLPITDLQAADPLSPVLIGRGVFDSVPMRLRLVMNPRSFRWTIDLLASTGDAWVQGHALVARADVMRPYRPFFPEMPPGLLYCAALLGGDTDPEGFDTWRTTHVLRYRPVADL